MSPAADVRIKARMIELGHTPVCDALGFRRYTCTVCGRAGLNPSGVDYGSGLEVACEEQP